MSIDFNQPPYFDDYYEKDSNDKTPLDKGYYKILFQPSVAVQTRELNQLQTMIQTQIEKFGSHIFREGSLVLGGQFDYQRDVKYVRLNASEIEDFEDIDFNQFIGKKVRGKNSNLKAFILATEFDEDLNVQVLIVRYLNSNLIGNDEVFAFLPSEEVEIGNNSFPVVDEDPTGNSSIFSIEEGVLFTKGYFVQFLKQTVIVDKYSSFPTKSIGLVINRPLIRTFRDDETLFDNARGSFNFTAPGADRLTLLLKLVSTDNPENFADQDFSLLAKIENGLIEESKERSSYAEIYNEIAKRTYDESGDYYVRGLTVRTREALDTGNNEGLDPNGDPNQISIDVEPGLAYVKGYEINNLVTKHVLVNKGIDFKFVNNSLVNARTGGFVIINEIVGSVSADEGTIVDLYDGTGSDNEGENRVTNNTPVTDAPLNNKIGEARIKTVLYNSGQLGTAEGSLQLYLFDIRMDPGFIISDVRSIHKSNVFFADVKTALSNTIENTLIYPIGTSNTRKIRKQINESQTDTNFSFYTTLTTSVLPSSKIINVSSPVPLNYSTGLLSLSERRTIFVSVNGSVGAPNNFPAGKHLNLGDPSVSVNVISATSFTINLGDTFDEVSGSTPVTVTYKGRAPEIFETEKELIPNVLVKINYEGSNSPATLTSPINLGFPDVWRIKEVRRKMGGEDFDDENDGEDVTQFFRLDNGQRDNFYDHAKLVPLSGITINADDRLLIKLDAFRAISHSYFSVDSYPVDDTQVSDTTIFTYQIPKYISSAGTVFDLRDSIDSRPYKQSTSTYTSSFASASTNPVVTNNFVLNSITNKLLIPFPSSPIKIDYSYFIGRRDVLTVDQKGVFSVVTGVSSLVPTTPSVSENVMPIANIFIPPFPSISQTFARLINWKGEFVTNQKIANKRFTMKDIGSLKSRVENLEIYNILNTLEKNTNDQLIFDENGLNRLKNGFFVDAFVDHSLGDTDNPDYNIAVDPIEQVIRPVFKLDSFQYKLAPGGVLQQTGNLVHLPLESEAVLINQPNATTRRNIEQSVYRFVGQLDLTPDTDAWVDETTIDREFELGNGLESEDSITTEWGSWQRHIVGYDAFGASGNILGTFNSLAEANAQIRNLAGGRGSISTISTENRSGIRTSVFHEKELQEIGNFVTDVSVIPYIRPQGIEFYARGIKPNTRHWVFFDGEEMTAGGYVRQYTDVDNPVEFTSAGSVLRANEFGEIRGVIFLPVDGKRFRIGSKEIKITDNPTISLDDITSIAENYFLASGINVQKQNTILSTKSPPITQVENVFEESGRRFIRTQTVNPPRPYHCCIGYTFRVDIPPEDEGTFLTSIDLFFQELHPDLGFRVQIRELNSAGNITQNVLPYSEVWVPRKVPNGNGSSRIDNPIINVSEDGSLATNVEFKAPVFVYNDINYAIVVSAENINPDTYLWISRLGETDLITKQPVTSRPLTGTMFTTNNGVNWDIVPQADLKVKLYRAKFQTSTTNQVSLLQNKGYEFFTITANNNNGFKNIGEQIKGSQRISIADLSGGSVAPGQKIVGLDSGEEATVVSVSGINVFTTGFDFENGERIEFLDPADNDNLIAEAEITNIVFGLGILRKYKNSKIELSETNGWFFTGAIVRGKISEDQGTITSIDSFGYNSTTLKPDYLDFNRTQISFEKRGKRSSNNTFIPYQDGASDDTSTFEEELHILSRSTERSLFGSAGYSADVRIVMKTETEYLSPMVDTSRANSVYIFNLINDDISGEDEPFGGNLNNKYISKTITLDDGQDAEDLLIFLSAYRPPDSDIKVWMKIRNDEDPELFSEKPWIEMIPDNNEFSSAGNEFDFKSYSFSIPDENKNEETGIVQYDVDVGNSDPVTLFRFKQFSVKIGILSNNSSIIPKVADMRAIALQL